MRESSGLIWTGITCLVLGVWGQFYGWGWITMHSMAEGTYLVSASTWAGLGLGLLLGGFAVRRREKVIDDLREQDRYRRDLQKTPAM